MTLSVKYALTSGEWQTPAGNRARFTYRQDTNDLNTINAALDDDEYQLPKGLRGLALDIGAHLGSVTVALALDNPALRVYAVEPVPENAVLLRENIVANGLTGRVRVIEGAAGKGRVTVRYGFRGNEIAEHHAWIGNALLVDPTTEATELDLPAWSLSELATEQVAFAKVDIEGAEFQLLDDPAVALVRTFAGEWHPSHGTQRDILRLLSRTHDVVFTGPQTGPGGFRAVRR